MVPWLLAAALAGTPSYRSDQSPGDEAQVERGAEIFKQCASCHGAKGEGKLGVAPRLNSPSFLSIVSNEFLSMALENRQHRKDVGIVIDEDQKADVVAMLRSWQTEDGVELDESPLKGDPDRGERLFTERCQACHAQDATGYLANGIGIPIGRKSYLDRTTNGMLRAFIIGGKGLTPMHGYANPDADTAVEVDSIIAYLRRKPW